MAIAFDNAASTSSASNVASLTTASWTIAGSDRILMGGIASGAGSPADPTTMKWGGSGGTALTKRGSTVNIGSFGKASQYSLVAPAAASQTLYGEWPSNQDETVIGGVSYTGVDQVTPHGTQATATGSDATPSVNVSSAAGEVVSDVVFHVDVLGITTGITAGTGQTYRVEIDQVGGGSFESFGMSEEAGAGTVTMSHAIAGPSSPDWGILGIPLKPAAGGAADAVPQVWAQYRRRHLT